MASTTASNLGGAWFGELASALQGTWQAVAATAGEDPRQLQQQKPARGGGSSSSSKTAAGGKAAQGKEEGDVARCGGAMSDTTLYLLLDRFTPN